MIEATYIVLEHIKNRVNAILSPDTLSMYPGKFAAQSSDLSSATYNVRLGVDFGQPYISTDVITLSIYHQQSDVLQRILGVLLKDLNPENTKDNPTLYTAGINEDIKFLSVSATVGKQDNTSFIEGTEYFVAAFDIMIEYVNLAGPDINGSQRAYINGV